MRSWPSPFVPDVPGHSGPIQVHDTASGRPSEVTRAGVTGLYVCGITPYDATHLGHAATYVTFDVLHRALRDAGHDVRYVQNVTDIDEPLLERAERDGVTWQDLAWREIDLYREDMTALSVIAPDHFLGVVESMDVIVESVRELVRRGVTYTVAAPDGSADVYLDLASAPGLGEVSGMDRDEHLALFAERGGDPEREGKRDALDPLLWRAARAGEPSWDGVELGRGRPGWHIECTALAAETIGVPFAVQGGGSDLIFPHHEMSAIQGRALSDADCFATVFVHQGMVGLHGEKMSKSKGNLVKVSDLRAAGVDPMVIRLALLGHHYRADWEWAEGDLTGAQERLDLWRRALGCDGGPDATAVVRSVRERVADDLDTPGALAAVDDWARHCLEVGGDDPAAPGLVSRLIDRVLGLRV